MAPCCCLRVPFLPRDAVTLGTMRFIGLDLAWGERARTGVAALDDAGRLVSCACVTTDDEIAAFAAEHAPGDCVIAIDAPLIVPNEVGQRVAERLVARRFGRYAAAAYPANRGNSLFNPQPRALRLEPGDLSPAA